MVVAQMASALQKLDTTIMEFLFPSPFHLIFHIWTDENLERKDVRRLLNPKGDARGNSTATGGDIVLSCFPQEVPNASEMCSERALQ
jgi:hypothetical protein